MDAVRPVYPWPINFPVGIPNFFRLFESWSCIILYIAEELVSQRKGLICFNSYFYVYFMFRRVGAAFEALEYDCLVRV